MSNPQPRSWVAQPLIEWTPWKLEGYEEAAAKVARGESPFDAEPAAPAPVKRTRTPRSLASLQAERDRVAAQIARYDNTGPIDTAAGRLGADALRAHYKHTDGQLERYTRLSQRLAVLESKIRRRTA